MPIWAETEHPRTPRGQPGGGQFASKGGSAEVESIKPGRLEQIGSFKERTSLPDNVVDLSPPELKALNNYVGDPYSSDLNSKLRLSKKMVNKDWITMAGLDTAINKGTLAEDTLLFRGVRPSFLERLTNMKVGATFVDEGFTSTSYARSVLEQEEERTGVMKILAPKGSKALVVPTSIDTESEVILPRNSKFEYMGLDNGEPVLKLVSGQQETTAEHVEVGAGGEVADKTDHFTEASQALKDGGFEEIKVADLPGEVTTKLGLKAPAGVSSDHLVIAQSLGGAMENLQGTLLEEIKLGNFQVCIAQYEPKQASMSMVTGGGLKPTLLVNTAHTYVFPGEGLAYAGVKAQEHFEKTRDRAGALKLETELSLTHELAHMADKVMGGELTGSLIDHLILSGKAKDNKSLVDYLTKNISEYAAAGPKDAMAEAVSRYIHEGSLPKPLDEWAKNVLVKHGEG